MKTIFTLILVFASVVMQARQLDTKDGNNTTTFDNDTSKNKAEVKIDHEQKTITLGKITRYAIYDQFGNKMLEGEDNIIYLGRYCARGTRYYLRYDDQNFEFHFIKPRFHRRK